MIVKAHHIAVEGKSRRQAEQLLGEKFNEWAQANPGVEVFHIFEPCRYDRTFGDYNYNEYHTLLTFFYRERLPAGLRELAT